MNRVGGFFMHRGIRKKSILSMLIVGMICSIYIFIIDAYSKVPVTIATLDKKISVDEVVFDRAGVEIKGSSNGEVLTEEELLERVHEMATALSHEDDCSRICQLEHIFNASIKLDPTPNGNRVQLEGEDDRCHYIFTIRSEGSSYKETYYDLKLMAKEDMLHLDQMKIHGMDLLNKWCGQKKEYMYFAGELTGEMNKERTAMIVHKIFKGLNAAKTNYYEDKNETHTCAYYGYCPYIDDYYKETNGYRTNTQIAFNYNEIEDITEVRVAFPFYNEVF